MVLISHNTQNLNWYSFRLKEEDKKYGKIEHPWLCFPSLSSNWSKQPFRCEAGHVVNPALLPQHLFFILMILRWHLAWGWGDQHPWRCGNRSRKSGRWKWQHLKYNIGSQILIGPFLIPLPTTYCTIFHVHTDCIYLVVSCRDIKEALNPGSFVRMHLQTYNKAHLYIINVKKLHIKALIWK